MTRSDNTKRPIRVFIASPGGLEEARRAFKKTIDELNKGFGDGAGVEFEALGWEDTLSPTGLRVQSEINKDVEACDLFLLVLHKLWGSKNKDAVWHPVKCLPGLAKLRPSNTMEEFSLAMSRWEGKRKRPIVHIVLKQLPADAAADPGPQLNCVLKFRKILAQSGRVLFKEWKKIPEFKNTLDAILRTHARADDQAIGAAAESSPKPMDFGPDFRQRVSELEAELTAAREEKRKAQKEARELQSKLSAPKPQKRKRKASRKARQAEDSAAHAERTRTETLALSLAESAARAALDGRIEEARQDFAKALDGATDLRVLDLGSEFFERTGELAEAERLLRRWLAISGPDAQTADTAAAYGNLGLIFKTRGDLDEAEKMHLKSLEINEGLNRLEGMAADYANLGVILDIRGDLDEAEKMHRKSLEINEKLSHLEGMATDYGNLGVIYFRRDDLDEAEKMQRKSLEINKDLGRLEGIARNIGNLGLIFSNRHDLDQAEKMYRNALQINQELGLLEGMAGQYGNLGLIFQTRGDLDEARKLYSKAGDLFVRIGMPHKADKYRRRLDELPHRDDDGS